MKYLWLREMNWPHLTVSWRRERERASERKRAGASIIISRLAKGVTLLSLIQGSEREVINQEKIYVSEKLGTKIIYPFPPFFQ